MEEKLQECLLNKNGTYASTGYKIGRRVYVTQCSREHIGRRYSRAVKIASFAASHWLELICVGNFMIWLFHEYVSGCIL